MLEMAVQRQRRYCSSEEGPNCIFLQDESLVPQNETWEDVDEIIKHIQGVSEFDLLITFQTFDQITRRYKGFVPDPTLSVDYGIYTVDIFFDNIKLSNDNTTKAF